MLLKIALCVKQKEGNSPQSHKEHKEEINKANSFLCALCDFVVNPEGLISAGR
jgi:hypothetical protein